MAYGTTYYCDSAGSNTAPYDTWAKAATGLQTILDIIAAGNVCYVRGTQTLSVGTPLDVDGASGSQAAGFCKFIGCAADGSVDGTRAIIDGVNLVAGESCIYDNSGITTYYWWENIEIKNADGSGVDYNSASDVWVWVNCISHNNEVHGWDQDAVDNHKFIRCQAYSNGSAGWANGEYGHWYVWCVATLNGTHGFHTQNSGYHLWCVSHANGADAGEACYWGRAAMLLINCVADAGVVGVHADLDGAVVLASRITNCTTGVDFSSELTYCGWNIFDGNTADLLDPTAWSENGVYAAYFQLLNETNTNQSDDAGTSGAPQHGDGEDSYNDQANNDFNLKATGTYVGDGDDVIDFDYGNG